MADIIRNPYNEKATYHELTTHEFDKDTVICAEKNEEAFIYQDGVLLKKLSEGRVTLSSISGIKKGLLSSKIKGISIRYFVKEVEFGYAPIGPKDRFPLANGEMGAFSGVARNRVIGFDVAKFDEYMKRTGLKPNQDGVIIYRDALKEIMGNVIKDILYNTLHQLSFMDHQRWRWNVKLSMYQSADEKKFMSIVDTRIKAAFADLGMQVADTKFLVR